MLSDAYCDLPDEEGTWVVRDLLPVSGALSFYGPPKAGKSWAILQLAYSIANGEPSWLGFPIERHGPVLYLQLDTPRGLWKARIRHCERDLGIHNGGQFHIADRDMMPFPFEILRPENGADWLRAECTRLLPLVVIVDVTRQMTQADEDKSGEMKRVYDAIREATKPSALILISHAKKINPNLPPDQQDNVINDNRGSSYIPGAVDGIVKLTNKRLMCSSRTMEEKRIPVTFSPSTLWKLDTDEDFLAMIQTVVADPTLESDRARGRVLASMTGKSEDAARKAIARARPSLAASGTGSESETPATD